MKTFSLLLCSVPALLLAACESKAPEPATKPADPIATQAPKPTPPAATTAVLPTPKPAATAPVSPDDPLKGQFSIADATKGIAGAGALTATIDTDEGKFECKLYDDKAPNTVANFVGLARGLRPSKGTDGKWVAKPAYDGTGFHRVIKGFMIQGGDPKGDGSGEPGYVIADEIWPGAKHDRAGLLCMANRGHNTNGQQFFITDAPAANLDGNYTIFGECTPTDLVTKIASAPTQGDRAVKPTKIKGITVKRK